MQHRSNSEVPPKLLRGRQRFEQWRHQKETRGRLPDHLWSLAVDLAKEFGLSKTAKTLRLEYNRLKRKSQSSDSGKGSKPVPRPTFLELKPHSALPVECTIDCQRAPNQTIRIDLKGPDWPDITAICQRLWGTHE
jgi:hypothetical protein